MKIIYLLLIFLPFLSAGQQLQLFESYDNCTIGIKDIYGKVLYTPQFSSALYQHPYYLIEKEGFWGILDSQGKLLVQPKYESVSFYGNYLGVNENFPANILSGPYFNKAFIVSKSGKYGAINARDSVVVPLIYESLKVISGNYPESYAYFTFGREGRTGVMDNSFKELIPPVYDDVSFAKEQPYPFPFPLRFFITGNYDGGRKYGINDLSGKEILPPQFENIEVKYSEGTALGNPWIAVYDSSFCMYDFQGEHRFCLRDHYRLVNLSDENGSLVGEYAIVNKNVYGEFSAELSGEEYAQQYLISMKTLKRSVEFSQIYLLPGCFAVYAKGRWMILNEDLSVKHSFAKNVIIQEIAVAEHGTWKMGVKTGADSIVYISPTVVLTVNSKPRDPKPVMTLFNVNTEENSRTYNNITPVYENGKFFFWCTVPDKKDEDLSVVDIYDSRMNLVTNLSMRFMRNKLLSSGQYSAPLVIQSAEGKYGLSSADGKTIVPFNYKTGASFGKSDKLFVFTDASGDNRLVDAQGKDVLGRTFKELVFKDERFTCFKSGKSFITDGNYRIIEDRLDLFWEVTDSYPADEGYYFMRDSTLFVLRGENFVPYASAPGFDHFTYPRIVQGKYLVDRNSKVLSSAVKMEKIGNLFLTIDQSGNFRAVDENGKVTAEERSVTGWKAHEYIIVEKYQNYRVLNKTAGNWVTPGFSTQVVWIRQRYGVQGAWFLDQDKKFVFYTPDGKLFSANQFDFPFTLNEGELSIAAQNNRFGLVDASLKAKTPFIYTNMMEIPGGYAFMENGKWGLMRGTDKVIDAQFDAVVNKFPNGKIIVLKDGNIGVLSADMEYLMKLTAEADLMMNATLLNVLSNNGGALSIGIELGDLGTNALNFKLKNELLFNWIRDNNTSFQVVEKMFTPTGMAPQGELTYIRQINYLPEIRDLSLQTYFRSKRYHSYYYREVVHNIPAGKKYDGKNYRETVYRKLLFSDNGVFREIEFSDIFIPGSDYTSLLRELLAKEINQRQIFGPVCIDLPAQLDEFLTSPYLSADGIHFVSANTQKWITIPYFDLRKVLKYPSEFR